MSALIFLTFSLFATWFGVETVIASSGAIAADGLSGGRAEPFGYAICMVLFGLLIAYRLRAGNFTTLSDFFAARFGAASEKLSAGLMVPTSLIWAAAQAVAMGYILAQVTGLGIGQALLAGTIILTVYSVIGGLLGDIVTDMVQGVIIIMGLTLTAVFLIFHLGGAEAVLAPITPDRLDIYDPETSPFVQIDEWSIAILGSLQTQEIVARLLAAKSPGVARRSCYAAASLYFLIGMIPAFLGLAGAQIIMPDAADTDGFLPALAEAVLPGWVYVMFMGALISAILSTIDSTLLAIAALVGHNLILPLRAGMDDKAKILLQRGLVAVSGAAVYAIAATGESIYTLIEISSSFGSAGLVVCVLFGLWTRMGGPVTAVVTLVCGAVLAYIFQYVMELEAGYLASVMACVLIYVALSGLETYKERSVLSELAVPK